MKLQNTYLALTAAAMKRRNIIHPLLKSREVMQNE